MVGIPCFYRSQKLEDADRIRRISKESGDCQTFFALSTFVDRGGTLLYIFLFV